MPKTETYTPKIKAKKEILKTLFRMTRQKMYNKILKRKNQQQFICACMILYAYQVLMHPFHHSAEQVLRENER